MLIVTAWMLKAPEASAAFTLKLYALLVSKSGTALKVTAPVALSMVKAPASAPLSEYVTVPPAGSVAEAV